MTRNSLFKKMIVFGCAVSIMPLLILGYFSYQKSSEAVQQLSNESRLDSVDQLRTSMEQLLKSIDYTMSHIVSTPLVQESIYQSLDYRKFDRFNNLTKELALLKSPITGVEDVILASYASDWLINNDGLSDFESFEHKELLEELMTTESVTSWRIIDTRQVSSTYYASQGCRYSVVLAKKTPYLSAEKRGLIAVNIPTCELADLINEPFAGDMMVLDEHNRIIVHPQYDRIGLSVQESGYLIASEAAQIIGESGQFSTGDNERSVTYIRSSFNDWTFISFTEMSELTRKSREIGWFTASVCMAVVLGSIVLVWLGSRRVYSPIHRLFQDVSQRMPELRGGKMSEIQAINAHFREMFASITTLTTEVGRHREQSLSLFLNEIFIGTQKLEDSEEKLRLYGLDERLRGWNRMTVLTLQIDLLENTRYEPSDLELLSFAIQNIVEEMVPERERMPIIAIGHTQVLLIGSLETEPGAIQNQLYLLTERMQRNIRDFLDLDVSIGISLPFNDLSHAFRAYREGLEALKQRMKLGKGVIVPYFSLNAGNHSNVYFYPKQIENELIDAVRAADEARAHEALRKWLSEVFQKERAPHEYQISLVCLLNEMLILMQEANVPRQPSESQVQSFYEQLLQLYIGSEIEVWFQKKIIAPIIEACRERQESTYHNLSEQIIHIIEQEYDRDITLEECASRLHYNLYYVSTVFKKETGVTFSDYLAMYRLNKAKRLLIETDLPVKDIAERLTYNNPQNFIRYFRRLEGTTPGQFRKNHQLRSE